MHGVILALAPATRTVVLLIRFPALKLILDLCII